ncbi:Hypothetical protein R9X50_00224400 [Acrodontium crateriforme]|uniref:ACB domain-containing protein n=1 Tax=Acrodontium crateriforme TaxID=150365 RepID=A0AAQ3R8E7_9PEZI|nr:Hypothetical protein R9X50_00224400 [Acrodontium crateriforme]
MTSALTCILAPHPTNNAKPKQHKVPRPFTHHSTTITNKPQRHFNMVAEQSAEFTKAVEDSRKLKAKPSDDELLKLYGLFKQGTQDPPFEESKVPGTFEFKEKAKRAAWQKIVDEGVTPADAQARYVSLVNELKEKHGYEG